MAIFMIILIKMIIFDLFCSPDLSPLLTTIPHAPTVHNVLKM